MKRKRSYTSTDVEQFDVEALLLKRRRQASP
jgi:hypothetical protein